jgi:hypothetical protein
MVLQSNPLRRLGKAQSPKRAAGRGRRCCRQASFAACGMEKMAAPGGPCPCAFMDIPVKSLKTNK